MLSPKTNANIETPLAALSSSAPRLPQMPQLPRPPELPTSLDVVYAQYISHNSATAPQHAETPLRRLNSDEVAQIPASPKPQKEQVSMSEAQIGAQVELMNEILRENLSRAALKFDFFMDR